MRWIGPFPTSNVAAMEISCLGLVLLVVAVWAWSFRGNAQRRIFISLSVACALGCMTAMVLLVATGSRAGTLAMLCGLFLLPILRYIPWKLAIGLQLILVTSTLFAPFQSRYTGVGGDSSALFRVTLATSALSMIHDHPYGLGDDAQEIFLDWYMPPSASGYNLGTTLNEATTCAIRHGVFTLATAAALIASVLCIGFQHSRRGHILPTLGLMILTTHITSGQFQAHIFSGWFIIPLMWCIGSALCVCGSVRTLHKRLVYMCGICAFCLCFAIIPLGDIFGSGKWATSIVDNDLFTQPRNQESKGLIAVINNKDISTKALNRFREMCYDQGQSLLWCGAVPQSGWAEGLPRPSTAGHWSYISIVAAGGDATDLWTAWRDGETDGIRVVICDPDRVPGNSKGAYIEDGLVIMLAHFGFNSMHEDIIHAAVKDAGGPPVLAGSMSATWWSQPQKLLDIHVDNGSRARSTE